MRINSGPSSGSHSSPGTESAVVSDINSRSSARAQAQAQRESQPPPMNQTQQPALPESLLELPQESPRQLPQKLHRQSPQESPPDSRGASLPSSRGASLPGAWGLPLGWFSGAATVRGAAVDMIIINALGFGLNHLGEEIGLQPLQWRTVGLGAEPLLEGVPQPGATDPVAICDAWADALHLDEYAFGAGDGVRTWYLAEGEWQIEIATAHT